MKQRTIRMIKIILGAYLIFIGSVHFRNMYEQKPSDMYLQILIAVFFIAIGITYMIWDVRKLVERILKEKAERAVQKEVEERTKQYKELHSSDKFRTAPMRVIKPISLEKMKENETIENIPNEESEESKESAIGIEISEESKESAIGIEISEEIESLEEE